MLRLLFVRRKPFATDFSIHAIMLFVQKLSKSLVMNIRSQHVMGF
jgi:hypothetical protein